VVFIHLTLAVDVHAQYKSIDEVRITLDRKNLTLDQFFQQIEAKSDFLFSYDQQDIERDFQVNLDQKRASVEDYLKQVAQQASLTFRQVNNSIDIKKVERPVTAEKSRVDVTVSGTVTDENGEAIPGVTVSVPGTTIGTASDLEGNYSLAVPERATLVFSFIGFESQSIDVGDRSVIDVTLVETISSLDEVVVVGYGSVKRSDLTGSIKSISMDDIPPSANINLAQALRGYAAGLNVQGGSTAGSEPSISVRGQTTLSASTRPLIVLDGIIFDGAISDINVADVEQIDVLKDASAAAIYGSRSANGVLLITTKKGEGRKPRINFNTYYGFQDYTNNPVKMMDAEQYARRLVDYNYFQYLYNWYAKSPTGPNDQGGRPVHPGYEDQSILNVLKSEDERENFRAGNEINWIDEVTQTAPISEYNLNISGAGEGFNYYVSGSYTDQKGVQVGDRFKRTTLNSKVEGDLTDWLTVGLNTSYSHRDHSGVEAEMQFAQNASPLASKYDEDGMYPVQFNEEFLMRHPLRSEYFDNEDIRKNIFATVYARVKVPGIEGLAYDFNYSNNYSTRSNNTYYPSNTYEGRTNNGRAIISNSERTNWIFNHILNYSNEIVTNHRVDVTLVYTRDKTFGKSSDMDANRFSNEILGYNNVGFAEQFTIGSGAWDESAVGYMARVNYIFNEKYLLTGTYRKDGFSGFGAENKFADFYSLSGAWNISEEAFMGNTNHWLDFLKFRLSYGENGNQGIGRYSSLSRMGTLLYAFGSNPAIGVGPTTLGNAGLSWETTQSTNIGVDYSVLKNRISGEIDLYTASTKDVLVTRSLPGATGYRSVWTNIGEIANNGIEAELRTVNLEGPLRWESRFVFSRNRDEIVTLYGDGRDDIGNEWFIGEPISAIYDYRRTGGIWTEEELYRGETHEGFYPGQFRLEDLNGDNTINPGDDRTIVGYETPNYRFSIGNNISYKNFTFSFLINSIQGGNGYYIGDLRRLLEATSDYDYAQRQNQPAIRENWTPDNGVDNAPAVYNYPKVPSGNYQDRSFVRLQDVSLRYMFDQHVLNRYNMQSLQVYISGKNLYTWTDWEGFDPELGGWYDMMMRDISLGIRLGF
jgi:TonB-linked SusC/RagA family outer membrane protein